MIPLSLPVTEGLLHFLPKFPCSGMVAHLWDSHGALSSATFHGIVSTRRKLACSCHVAGKQPSQACLHPSLCVSLTGARTWCHSLAIPGKTTNLPLKLLEKVRELGCMSNPTPLSPYSLHTTHPEG